MGKVGLFMRYVQKRVLGDGKTHYRFNPPQYLVDEGVVCRKELGTDVLNVKTLAKLSKINTPAAIFVKAPEHIVDF